MVNNMKNLNQFVNEQKSFRAFRVNQDYKPEKYSCQPKDKDELKKIIKERLEEDPDADLNDIDVSKIRNMSQLFWDLDPHNINVSDWDMSNIEDTNGMFVYCYKFNCDLSKWDMSKAKNINCMFAECRKFEGKGLENWDVSNVENMENIFAGCYSLKNKPSWYK